jgi:hypothetical protein
MQSLQGNLSSHPIHIYLLEKLVPPELLALVGGFPHDPKISFKYYG